MPLSSEGITYEAWNAGQSCSLSLTRPEVWTIASSEASQAKPPRPELNDPYSTRALRATALSTLIVGVIHGRSAGAFLSVHLRRRPCPGRLCAGRCSGAAPWVKSIKDAVEVVGDVCVIERGGVRVVAQGGSGIAVTEAGLGLE